MATTKPQNGATEPSGQEVVNRIISQDEAKGMPVHSFDPNASPAEKAASAGKARSQLKSVKDRGTADGGGRGVALDTGTSGAVPTITVSDADAASKEHAQCRQENDTPTPIGGMPAGVAPAIPDWYKVGWRQVGGVDEIPLTEGEQKDRSVLELFLKEQYYGDWYYNAALIIFAVFTSHFLTRFGFGWGWLFILLAVCNTYYTTSMTRVRRRARDDIQRELVKTGLISESESANWINHFLDRFWKIYEPVLSASIVSSVDQVLSTSTPPFLDSLRLSTFTLGTKSPRIDRVRTYPKTPEDIVTMDWHLSFTPNDVSDITPNEAKYKVNPKIVLDVRVGKGLATAAMPILLEDLEFTGKLKIRLKLMTNFPHVQMVDICFTEKPLFDYVLKPIGGETFGFDIGNIPGLSSFIRDMVHSILQPMMYEPNVFTLNLEQLLAGTPLDAAIGVVQVRIQTARGIKGGKLGGGTPDPYVKVSINNRATLGKTHAKKSTANPTWNETLFILVNSLQESLVLSLFDYNDHRADSELGAATFELASLLEDSTQEGINSTILKDGKDRGQLRYDVSYYPVLKPTLVDGKEELPETTVGIVRLTIHQAKELDHTKSLSGDLNPLCKLLVGGNKSPIHTTSILKHSNNPVWESSKEFLCADKTSSVITLQVIDDRDFLKDPVVGHMTIRLEDLLAAKKEAGKDWWPLSGCKSGRLRLSVEWKPLSMAGSLAGADQYRPPIGVVRLWIQKATDLKNVEATLGGKSDPYVSVQVNNIIKGRTEVVNNNLNPEWDQIVYIPVHSLRESIILECMDYQNLTKDRSLGTVELHVNKLAKESDDNLRHPYESLGIKTAAEPICLDHGNQYKGQLHFVAEFVPALAVKGIKFETGPNELQQAVRGGKDSDTGDTVDDSSSSSSSSDEIKIPEEITSRRPLGASEAKEANPSEVPKPAVDATGNTEPAAPTEPKMEEVGVAMAKDELLKQQSGVIVFNVISGQLAKKARLEVLMDDGYWPAFSTLKAGSCNAHWQYVGEGFIKELDFGRVWLRLNENDEGESDDIIAEWKGDAKAFLESALDGPTKYTLEDEQGVATSTVEIEARFVPVPVKLEPRESINNQGTLRVDLLDGHDIHGADRGGKSDPYAVFSLNGQKVFKSQTKKKTITPDWQENFVVSVPSRVGADFTVEVFDWNQLEQAKSLGSGKIDLVTLEPFQATESVISLTSSKHGQKGEVRVRLLFQPEIIAKSRKNTSTFSAAGRAMTQFGALPVGAGRGVLQGVGGIFKKDKDHVKQKDDNGLPPIPDIPAGQASHPVDQPDALATSAVAGGATIANGNGPNNKEPGTLRVTVLDAKDLSMSDSKAYCSLRVGDKEHRTKHANKTASPEWNEAFSFTAGSFTSKLFVWIYDHKTLGKDKLLGRADIDIWRHLEQGQISSAVVSAELVEGQGLLHLRLEFDPTAVGRVSPVSSTDKNPNLVSPSRFSLRGRRSTGGDD